MTIDGIGIVAVVAYCIFASVDVGVRAVVGNVIGFARAREVCAVAGNGRILTVSVENIFSVPIHDATIFIVRVNFSLRMIPIFTVAVVLLIHDVIFCVV